MKTKFISLVFASRHIYFYPRNSPKLLFPVWFFDTFHPEHYFCYGLSRFWKTEIKKPIKAHTPGISPVYRDPAGHQEGHESDLTSTGLATRLHVKQQSDARRNEVWNEAAGSTLTQRRMLREDKHGLQRLCRRNIRAEPGAIDLGGCKEAQWTFKWGERRAEAGHCILMSEWWNGYDMSLCYGGLKI